jgi:hypothetical protein
MARSVGIMAYGSPEDRLRLEALTRLENKKSSSEWLIAQIRQHYDELFGDQKPEDVLASLGEKKS